jgi:hypothetical protein
LDFLGFFEVCQLIFGFEIPNCLQISNTVLSDKSECLGIGARCELFKLIHRE